MTPDQFRAALADLGYSQAAFARLAMVDARTVRRWCDGTRAVPGPVVALLQMMVEARVLGAGEEILTMEWQPIETAPRDGTFILVYEPSEKPKWSVMVDFYIDAPEADKCCGWLGNPTHWMPLPDPPKQRLTAP
jgi:hypothetical protein